MPSRPVADAAGEGGIADDVSRPAIVHDLNNLLAVILSAATAIADQAAGEPQVTEAVADIRQGVARSAALVQLLLDHAGEAARDASPIDPDAALLALAPLLRRLLGPAIALNLVPGGRGARIACDHSGFDRVFLNLAANAAKAMPDGGTLTIRVRRAARIGAAPEDAAPASPGPRLVIEVADTGHGIAAELLPHIFDPHVTTRGAQGGRGLGLASVRAAVHASGGEVAVTSAPGQGARFRLDWPCLMTPAASQAPGRQENISPSRPAGAGRRVLIVEDEESLRRLAERILLRDGWDVVGLDSAEAALERSRRWGRDPGDPDLSVVIADIALPGMDGASLVAAMRSASPSLAAILTSGYVDPAVRTMLSRQNVQFLAKPYTPEELCRAVEASLAMAAAPALPEGAKHARIGLAPPE
ncbi:MAG: response regulator [Rhodospirillales bacterium]|nr:response regulator [Rhodospirillales bacterium]